MASRLLFLLLLGIGGNIFSEARSTKRLIVCEHSTVQLTCAGGRAIRVYSANYGRRDAATCSSGRPHYELQNVRCSRPTNLVAQSCNGRSSCSITAINSVFGDPCFGTYKYLHVAYRCRSRHRCRDGWTPRGDKCFRFINRKKTWTSAEHYCRRRGGHLASFHSYSDLNFLRSLVHHRTRSFRNTWVGATDRVWDGVWKWTDGSWYNYSRWYPGEPNNWFGREDCLEINFRGSDRTNDEKCHARRPFICARRR
uniref:Uncharacterized protein n=1 Tax=Nothobranchius furzeri TaxID=105023 RepID=A0A8C6PXC6_NOTFU